MLRQYLDIKDSYKDYLLLFQVGDFFEVFFDDAKTVSDCLSIRLTSRDKDKENPIPMCGVPIHALENYIPKLLAAGYSCVLVEQVEDAGVSKGPVKREITRVITPAVRFDNEGLDERSVSYVASASFGEANCVISLFDVSTGSLISFAPAGGRDFETILFKYAPKEFIVSGEVKDSSGNLFVPIFKDYLSLTRTKLVILEDAKVEFKSLGFESKAEAQLKEVKDSQVRASIDLLLAYVQSLAVSTKVLVSSIQVETQGTKPSVLDAATRRNLELCESTLDGSKKDSLLGVLDRTRTAAGGRLLYDMLLSPLTDIGELRERQGVIKVLIESGVVLESIRESLSGVRDLDRLSIRLMNGRIGPYELGQLRDTFQVVPSLGALIREFRGPIWDSIMTAFNGIEEPLSFLKNSLVDSLPPKVGESDIFLSGYNEELDRLRSLKSDVHSLLNQLEQRERENSGIQTLRVKHNSVFGFFIEISKGQAKNAPENYIRRQTLTNVERYSTKELSDLEVEINSAEIKYRQLELHLYKELRTSLQPFVYLFRNLSLALSKVDVYSALALVARNGNYICPELTEESLTVVKNARHPVVESVIGKSDFVPNDIVLGESGQRFAVLTGPNMGGKSTYLKQVGIIQILAQIGSYVPAERALIGIADKIFTRIGANDALVRGESTFMVEMKEAATILKESTSRSLVLIDEVGRGTSTTDGLAIAGAIADTLLKRNACRTIFATHFFELTELPEKSEYCFSLSAGIVNTKSGLKFSHRIERKKGSGSYGLHVARLAGVPSEVVDYAEQIVGKEWEVSFVKGSEETQTKVESEPRLNSLIEVLNSLNPDVLSPIDALNTIYRVKSLLREFEEG